MPDPPTWSEFQDSLCLVSGLTSAILALRSRVLTVCLSRSFVALASTYCITSGTWKLADWAFSFLFRASAWARSCVHDIERCIHDTYGLESGLLTKKKKKDSILNSVLISQTESRNWLKLRNIKQVKSLRYILFTYCNCLCLRTGYWFRHTVLQSVQT